MSHAHPQHTPDYHDNVNSWHDHSHDQRPQDAHTAEAPFILVATMGVAGFLLIAATIGATIWYYTWYNNGLQQKLVEDETRLHDTAIALREKNIGQDDKYGDSSVLGSYGWVNSAAPAPFHIPVDKAKDKVIAQYAAGIKVPPSGPTPPTPPAAPEKK